MSYTPITLTSAAVEIFFNSKPYRQARSISWNISYGMTERYGIDSPWPQEIADGRASVGGRITAIATGFDGGIAAFNLRALVSDILQSPYSALRVVNRSNGDTLLYVPQIRITSESIDAVVKGVVTYSFSWVGLVPYTGVDLAYAQGS